MRPILFGLFGLAVAGCFDPDKASGNGTESSADSSGTSAGCSPGQSGCPCYGNATCDAGLVCNATVELCIPEDCVPGSEDCTCNDGVCLAGLECIAGVCSAGSATTDPVTTDPVTTDPATTDPATTDPATTDPVTTDPVTTDPVTTDPSTTDSATDTTDTSPIVCQGECAECVACLGGPEGGCVNEYTACAGDPACQGIADCCAGDDPELCALCCAEAPDAAPIYNGYLTCLDTTGQCPGCTPLSCV